MYVVDYPFEACYECTNIEDCPNPDVELSRDNGVCLPIPPEVCPKRLKIALTKRKRNADMDTNNNIPPLKD